MLSCSPQFLRNIWLTFHSTKRKVSKWNNDGLMGGLRIIFQLMLICPVPAFIYCLFEAYTDPNQHGMYTHCGVNNFAVSVSEAIAKPQRSRIIWTTTIVIHAPLFIFFSLELAKFYVDYLYNKTWTRLKDDPSNYTSLFDNSKFWKGCLLAAIITGLVELGCLVGLTFVTSHNVDYFAFHQACVGGFLFSGASHMLLSTNKVIRISQKKSLYYNQSHLFYAIWRQRLSRLVVLDGALMFYLYYRHNRYCEPYMYSMFCLSEYLVIIFIMIYHNLGPLLLNQHRWQKSAPCWAGHREIVSTDSDEANKSINIDVTEEEIPVSNQILSDGTTLV